MMNRRTFPFLLILMILFSGCQLAQADPAGSLPESEDQIVGMLIAFDKTIPAGEKRFAQLQETEYETEDGAIHTSLQYQFPEGSGLTYMGYYISPELDAHGDGYHTSTHDEGIVSILNGFRTHNEISFVEQEAELYISSDAQNLMLYPFPVYQASDGTVYALGTDEAGYHAIHSDGQTVTYRQYEAGDSGSYVSLTLHIIDLPSHYRILQLDSESRVLDTVQYAPEALPEVLVPSDGCAYVILETWKGGQVTERSVCSPDDESKHLQAFYPLENGICSRSRTKVNWEETP